MTKVITLLWVLGYGVTSLIYGMTPRTSNAELLFLILLASCGGIVYWRVMYK